MIELRQIRTFIPPGQSTPELFEKGLEPAIYFKNLDHVVESYQDTVDSLPIDERHNLYVTLNDVDPEKSRRKESWLNHRIMFFDIDDVSEADKPKYEHYIKAISSAIKVSPENLVATETGGGFHIVFELKKPITDKKWFEDHDVNYQILCMNADSALQEAKLTGKCDRQVFSVNRMFRLPGTISKKPGRPDRAVKLVQSGTGTVEWDIQKATGLPNLMPEKDFMSDTELSYIKIDAGEVEKGCSYLNWAIERPNELSEPQWYAVLSIIGRLPEPEEKAHLYSKGHRDYSPTKTLRKLEQATTSAGPRTCDNINRLWKQCNKCPNYKKVRSPIAIKGENFIATAHSGFHTISPKGQLIPQYDDLRKYYDQEQPYINSAGIHYKFKDSKWQEISDAYIDQYAERKFRPSPKNNMCAEFRGKVKRTNLRDTDWFSKNTDRRVNFQNGVLDIDTMELTPHDPSFGFQDTLAFDYEPGADCPLFRRMLDRVTCGDTSKQTVLMEFLGYCLSNDEPRADKLLVLTGEGQNGKSRFLNIWKAMGGSGVRSLGISELANPFMLQRIDGALFNISEEVPSFTKKSFWEIMKNLTTGGTITVSRKFKDPYDFNNKAKFIMTCNRLPQGADQNHGYFRRLIIVDFDALFTDDDEMINNKTIFPIERDIDSRIIETEMSGVANIALKMYHRLKANNYEFTKSEAIDAAVREYREDLDSVGRWCEEHIELGETSMDSNCLDAVVEVEGGPMVLAEEMREDYARWCVKNGERPLATKGFVKKFNEFIHRQGGFLADHVNPSVSSNHGETDFRGQKVVKMRARIDGARKVGYRGIIYGSSTSDDY